MKISPDPRFSRVFPHGDIGDSLLKGIDPQWLIRWNSHLGHPNIQSSAKASKRAAAMLMTGSFVSV